MNYSGIVTRAYWNGIVGEAIGAAHAAQRQAVCQTVTERRLGWLAQQPDYRECMLRAVTCAEAADWPAVMGWLLTAKGILVTRPDGQPDGQRQARFTRLLALLNYFFTLEQAGPSR